MAIAGHADPFDVGLVWVVRDTRANRQLVAKYAGVFETRLPGSSAAWVRVLAHGDTEMPPQPGLIWCDAKQTRLFARRRSNHD